MKDMKIFLVLGVALLLGAVSPALSKGFDTALQFLTPTDLTTVTDDPESGDFCYRYDVDTENVAVYDCTDLSAVLAGLTSTVAELNILDGVTSTAAELNILDGVTATAAELNNIADNSARALTVSGAVAATCAANGTGVINYISSGSGNATITLPAATGTGCVYDFVWAAPPTASGDVIQVTGDDAFYGVFWMAQDGGDTAVAFETAADTDKLTFTSTTRGVASSHARVTFADVAADTFAILHSSLTGSGAEATPGATGQRP